MIVASNILEIISYSLDEQNITPAHFPRTIDGKLYAGMLVW